MAWVDQGAIWLQQFSLAGVAAAPPLQVGPGTDAILGVGTSGFAIAATRTVGSQLIHIGFDGSIGSSDDLPTLANANVHGLSLTGSLWQIGGRQSTGNLILQTGPLSFQTISATGTWVTTAWNGRTLGFSWREGTTCLFSNFGPTGAPGPTTRRVIATQCYDPEIAPNASGFSIAYHTSLAVRRPQLLLVDDDGAATSTDVDVGPLNGQAYSQVYAASVGALTYVLYSPRTTIQGPALVAVRNRMTGTVSAPQPIEVYETGLATRQHELVAVAGRLVVGWTGGTSGASANDTTIYVQLLCPP